MLDRSGKRAILTGGDSSLAEHLTEIPVLNTVEGLRFFDALLEFLPPQRVSSHARWEEKGRRDQEVFR